MFKKISTFIAISFIATLVLAYTVSAREFADIYTECGLGSLIAPRNSAVAAVTNVTWDLGTTAISSNITSPETCEGGKDKVAAFIHDSYDLLENDLARGNGEYLDTLISLSGINLESQNEFLSVLRNDFINTVASPSYSTQSRFEKSENLFNALYARIETTS